ncbi:MAG: anti-sigma factor domain-containing protein [Clostridia bacterium]|nr:anti-sigma factor domain-containing protein [Clostridia bacterium]
MYKGLIMEIKNDCLIVLTEDANYIKLKKKGNIHIGKKILFIEEDIIRERKKSLKSLVAIAAAIILMITTIISQFSSIESFKTYAIVSLDINPSLEFQIDKKEIVRKVRPLSKDGKELINNNMIGMKIEEAIILSIKMALDKKYINNIYNLVLVSEVIIEDELENPTVIEDKILEKVEKDKDLQDIKLLYLNSNKEDLEKARENQVSVGKYRAYEILSDKNPNIKIEDISDKKIGEIVEENKELAGNKKERVKKKKEVLSDKNPNMKIDDTSDKKTGEIVKENKELAENKKERIKKKKEKRKKERLKKKKNKKDEVKRERNRKEEIRKSNKRKHKLNKRDNECKRNNRNQEKIKKRNKKRNKDKRENLKNNKSKKENMKEKKDNEERKEKVREKKDNKDSRE